MHDQVFEAWAIYAALALVRPIVRDLRTAYLALRSEAQDWKRDGNLESLPSPEELPPPARERLGALAALFAELAELGVRLEDPELGIIAVPGIREGRPVSWCWKLGEDRIRTWYPRGSRYADRRPLRNDGTPIARS